MSYQETRHAADPATVSAVATALGLPSNAKEQEIRAAFDAVFGDAAAEPADPSAGGLTPEQMKICSDMKISPLAFQRMKESRGR